MFTKLRTSGVAVALALFLVIGASAPAVAAQSPTEFVADLGHKGIEILSNQDQSTRKQQFSTIFTSDFDVPAISKFVLGPRWRGLPPASQQNFVRIFGQYIVEVYAQQFSTYSGEQFKVLSATDSGPGQSVVASQIIRKNGTPINVSWNIANEGGSWKITDVLVENLSLAVTKRDEFASVIEQNGGSVDALISTLQQKIQEG